MKNTLCEHLANDRGNMFSIDGVQIRECLPLKCLLLSNMNKRDQEIVLSYVFHFLDMFKSQWFSTMDKDSFYIRERNCLLLNISILRGIHILGYCLTLTGQLMNCLTICLGSRSPLPLAKVMDQIVILILIYQYINRRLTQSSTCIIHS